MNEASATNPVQNRPFKINTLKEALSKLRQSLNPLWLRFSQTKFYTNKRIFWPVSAAFGLLFLTLFVGLIFGGRKASKIVEGFPTPSPISQEVPTSTPKEINTLSKIEQKLTDLKTQINELDVRQRRLQPPTINFKINF